jgi:uncharacterized protein
LAIRIDESFDVAAPADLVWRFLIDPAQVVQCLPGAELLEASADHTFAGRIRVKVGPVTAAYRGRARFEELDHDARRVRMVGEGQETAGGGNAKMTMVSTVEELPDGGARVRVESEVDVVGRLVQFGRGMIEEVSKQIFRQFAECVGARLAAEAAGAAERAVGVAPAEPAASGAAPAGLPGSPPERGEAPAAPAPAAPAPAAPVRALPLLWAALKSRLRRLFRR